MQKIWHNLECPKAMNQPIKQIYFATGNKEKIKDFQMVFREFGIELIQLQQKLKVDEDADSLLANAKKKALAYSVHNPSKIIMATDGGVKIPFLGDNWNHVLTKRLSGIDHQEKFTERQRAETLLDLMKQARGDERKVYWHEAIVLAWGNRIIFEFYGDDGSGVLLEQIPDDFDEDGYFWLGYLWFDPRIGKHYMAMTEEEKLASSSLKKGLRQKLSQFLTGWEGI